MTDRLPPYRQFLASDAAIRDVLRDLRAIAAVGVADDPRADAVLRGMRTYGYRVLPVQEDGGEFAGEPAHASLAAIPERVDIVCVFGDPARVPAASDGAAAIGARVLWLERGVANAAAAFEAHRRGLTVVMGRGLLDEYEMHFPDDELGYDE